MPSRPRLTPAPGAQMLLNQLPLLDPWHYDNVKWIAEKQNSNTQSSYKSRWDSFVPFCMEHKRLFLPASADTVIMYMRFLLKDGKARGTINDTTISAIKHYHVLSNFASPTDNALLKLTKRVIVRNTPAPIGKLPVTPSQLYEMTFQVGNDYIDTRDMFMVLLMFLAFLRRSEVVSLRYHDAWVDRDHTGAEFLNIFIETSKTDQGRSGDLVVLAANPSNVRLCPVQWCKRHQRMRNPWAIFLFHSSLMRSNLNKKLRADLPNTRVKALLTSIGVDPAPYGAHSCRRGGATTASASNVALRLIKRHGRWKSNCVELYIAENLMHKLSVSERMYLAM